MVDYDVNVADNWICEQDMSPEAVVEDLAVCVRGS